MFRIKFLLFFIVTFFPISKSFGQAFELSLAATVSVLTCGTGNEVYSLFGHTAIRIQDPARNFDTVYNYGAFDFDTPNFVARFSKGDLQYFITSDPFSEFLYSYNYDRRSVYEQQLNMSAAEKQRLFDELNATMASDARFYTYKFIDRNCTTMVVDILNKTLAETAIVKVDKKDQTYREVLYPYFDGHFYEQLGTSIIFGTKVDEKATNAFLPMELLESINVAKTRNGKLLAESKTWLEFEETAPAGSWWNNIYTYILLLVLIVVANSRIATTVYLIFAGAIGLFFSVAGFYSYHGELAWNYNALLFNPMLLLLAFFLLRRNAKGIFYISLFCIATIAIYIFFIINKPYLLIVLPLVIAHLIILGRFVRRYKDQSQIFRATA